MFRGSRRLLLAVAVGAAFALPAAALAGNGNGNGAKCNASACKVYIEPSLPNGTGQANTGQANSGGDQSSGGASGKGNVKPLRVPKKTSKALRHAGKDTRALTNLVRNPAFGRIRGVKPSSGYKYVAEPSALAAAVDVGSGPTVLLAALLGSALLLLAGTGFRGWRRWRTGRSSPRS